MQVSPELPSASNSDVIVENDMGLLFDTVRNLAFIPVGDGTYKVFQSAENLCETVEIQLQADNVPVVERESNASIIGETSLVNESPVANITPDVCDNAIALLSCREQQQRRKAVCPKGKKRKTKAIKGNSPRPPVTGYVMYLNKRREEMKKANPEMSFADVTKFLGNEWSQLSPSIKQEYLDKATADKVRYIRELKEYQESEEYQTNLKRKKLNWPLEQDDSTEPDLLIASEIDDEDSDALHCRVCDQYFVNLHNKREHMLGKQHLTNLTAAFQSDQVMEHKKRKMKASEQLTEEINSILSKPVQQSVLPNPVDVESFMEKIIVHDSARESKRKDLQKKSKRLKEENEAFLKEVENLQETADYYKLILTNVRTYGAFIQAQIDSLSMVQATLQGVDQKSSEENEANLVELSV